MINTKCGRDWSTPCSSPLQKSFLMGPLSLLLASAKSNMSSHSLLVSAWIYLLSSWGPSFLGALGFLLKALLDWANAPCIRKSPSVWHGLACLVHLVHLAGLAARNSYPPIFSQEFYITTIISEFLFFHNQFINSFPPEYLHESSNFVPSSFKLWHTWPCWLMFNFLCLRRLSLTIITICQLDSQALFVQQIGLPSSSPHLITMIWQQQNHQSTAPLTIAMASEVCSCCLFFLLPTVAVHRVQHDLTSSITYVAIHLHCS